MFLMRLTAFALLLLLLFLSGCEKCASPKKAPEVAKPVWNGTGEGFRTSRNDAEINLKDTRLATIPEDYDKWDTITFSADGRQVFYIASKKGKSFVVVGDKPGDAYDGVSFFVTSLDGRRFAFGGKTGEKKRLVIDNKELEYLYHEEVAPGAFSPDGCLVACEVGGFDEKEWFISVSDGVQEVYRSPVYPDTYRSPSFSPDGRLLVYELGDDKRGTGTKKRTVFSLDLSTGKIIKEERLCPDCWAGKFSFSSDSSRAVYEVQKEGKNFLVLMDFAKDEERKVELPYSQTMNASLSPDGEKIIYIAIKDGKHYLVESRWETAQGEESGPYEGISPAVSGPGPATIAYLAMKGGKWLSMVGDKEGAANYHAVGDSPVFSPDGLKIAYPAMKGGQQSRRGVIGGKWVMVVSPSNEPKKAIEGPAYEMVVTPVWSPDGKYLVYRARTGTMENAKRFIVIADPETGKVIKEGPVNDEVWPPVWSADGKAAGYGTRLGRELWWKVERVN